MQQPTLRQFLIAPPDTLDRAAAFGLPLVHPAFTIGADGHLHHPPLPPALRGGLMLLSVHPAARTAYPSEIFSLCAERGFQGVVLDLEIPPSPFLSRFIRSLEEGLQKRRLGFFLPEKYSNFSGRAKLMVSSALSGGSLERRLQQITAQYGADRIALCLRRVREDFFLPAPDGSGLPLTGKELASRIQTLDPVIFFSKDLCARYFTYMSRETGAHFLLFDDAFTLGKKRELAIETGITRFFYLLPEVEEILPSVIG